MLNQFFWHKTCQQTTLSHRILVLVTDRSTDTNTRTQRIDVTSEEWTFHLYEYREWSITTLLLITQFHIVGDSCHEPWFIHNEITIVNNNYVLGYDFGTRIHEYMKYMNNEIWRMTLYMCLVNVSIMSIKNIW